ncbi:condensation domain-containing protein [Agarilytica rhodophyticola]|uniref:condensation domain-containing protein n=1 Tax=Agarilytica rhodophyticola TaxID=1737490 RepID=UPI000CD7E6BC|nr:condensation domain-containing protein [Agarilytica rhodophyticola]
MPNTIFCISALHEKQSEILFEQLIYKESTHQIIGGKLQFKGKFEPKRLIKAQAYLADSSDIFRHRLILDDGVYWNRFEEKPTFSFNEVSFVNEAKPHQAADNWYKRNYLNRPFDISKPLSR